MIDTAATDKGTGASAHTQSLSTRWHVYQLPQKLNDRGVLANLPQVVGQCTDFWLKSQNWVPLYEANPPAEETLVCVCVCRWGGIQPLMHSEGVPALEEA